MRRLAATLLLLASVLSGAEGDQLDADERMFAVLAAINVAGYDDGVGSPADSLLRQAVRQQLADFDGESLKLLRNAYEQYRNDDPDENLAQYVTFALTCEPPPTFELKADLPTDLPPEVRHLRGFSRIVEQFYREAEIQKLWEKYQPAYDQELARHQETLVPMLFRTAGYLRLSLNGVEARGFKVWVDLLGAPGSTNTRLYGGNVQIVVHPSEQIRLDEIRHAYLIHMLDRLSIRYREAVGDKEVLSRFAMFAPALDEAYKSNFQLLVTKSLVKAIEMRLSRIPEEKKLEQINKDLSEGYILTPFFYEALPAYEKDGRIINRYYEEMIQAIDLKHEAARLQNVKFSEPTTRAKAKPVAPQLSEVDKLLQQGEFFLNEEMFDEARETFLAVEEKVGERQAQASYGLARVAIMEADPELAREHFYDAAHLAEDPHLKALAHLYIGRIEDVVGNREEAVRQYQLVLETGDPSERTRQLAQKGLDAPFSRPGSENESEPEP